MALLDLGFIDLGLGFVQRDAFIKILVCITACRYLLDRLSVAILRACFYPDIASTGTDVVLRAVQQLHRLT